MPRKNTVIDRPKPTTQAPTERPKVTKEDTTARPKITEESIRVEKVLDAAVSSEPIKVKTESGPSTDTIKATLIALNRAHPNRNASQMTHAFLRQHPGAGTYAKVLKIAEEVLHERG